MVGDYNNQHGQDLIALTEKFNLKHKIQFLGKKEGSEKFQLFASAYFTVMPSITENFGMVVVESMSQETPVIASTGTPWKILEDKKAGFWVAPKIDDLKISIEKIIDLDQATYLNYRKNAYKLVSDKFDMERNIQDWVEAYQSVFNHSTSISKTA